MGILSFLGCSSAHNDGDSVEEGAEYYLTLFGDSADGNHIFSELLRRSVYKQKPSFTLHTGDMIADYELSNQWPVFLSLVKTYIDEKNFYPVIGNHDVKDRRSLDLFNSAFPGLGTEGYYTRTLKDCYCIFLNSEDTEDHRGTIGKTQLNWLESQLNSTSAQDMKCRMVLVHRPLFPQNDHKEDPLMPRDELHNLFVKYDVEVVVSGHDHSYSRSNKDGVTYLIIGGAGSKLRTGFTPYHYIQVFRYEEYLLFRMIDIFGKAHDEFRIELH